MAPFAKLAFKTISRVPATALVEVERRGGEEIPVTVGAVVPPWETASNAATAASTFDARSTATAGTSNTFVGRPRGSTAADAALRAGVHAVSRLRDGLSDMVGAASRAVSSGTGGGKLSRSSSGRTVAVTVLPDSDVRGTAALTTVGDGAAGISRSPSLPTSSPTRISQNRSRALTAATFLPPDSSDALHINIPPQDRSSGNVIPTQHSASDTADARRQERMPLPVHDSPIPEVTPGEEADDEVTDVVGSVDPFAQSGRAFSSRVLRLAPNNRLDDDVDDVCAQRAAKMSAQGNKVTDASSAAADASQPRTVAPARAPLSSRRSSSVPRLHKMSDLLPSGDVKNAEATSGDKPPPTAGSQPSSTASAVVLTTERAFHDRLVKLGLASHRGALEGNSTPSGSNLAGRGGEGTLTGGHLGSVSAQVGRMLVGAIRAGIEANIPREELDEFQSGIAETRRRAGAAARANDTTAHRTTALPQPLPIVRSARLKADVAHPEGSTQAAASRPDPPREYPKLRLAHFAACLVDSSASRASGGGPPLDPEKAFAVFDTNADGVVERSEFLATVSVASAGLQHRNPHPSAEEIRPTPFTYKMHWYAIFAG